MSYSGKDVTDRMVKTAGGVQRTVMALTVLAKMKGRTNKQIKDAFGDDCPSWISGTFSYASKAEEHLVPSDNFTFVSELTLPQAEAHVLERISLHMTALGVASFEKYKKVCQYSKECEASKNILNPPAEDEAAPEPAAEAVPEPEPEPITGTEAEPPAERDIVAEIKAMLPYLMDGELLELAAAFNQEMTERARDAANPQRIADDVEAQRLAA
jgi:hypothetical protein